MLISIIKPNGLGNGTTSVIDYILYYQINSPLRKLGMFLGVLCEMRKSLHVASHRDFEKKIFSKRSSRDDGSDFFMFCF